MQYPNETDGSADTLLLEGLLQLAVDGNTDAHEFQQIGDEVFTRLLGAYGMDSQKAA